MRTIFKTGLILMAVAIILPGCYTSSAVSQSNVREQGPTQNSLTYQTFYDDLSPYGTWIDYPSYGHVWHPTLEGEFRPYLTNGYWNYSNEGWMWQSNFRWGWAPFHYGRWIYDNAYGWLWIPGYEWSPAWVTWGNIDGFYAWAPLMPEVNVGIGFGLWSPAALYWNFCRREHIYDRDVFNRVENREVVANNVSRINVINNFSTTNVHKQFYAKGPEVKEVERFTNHKIETSTIREVPNSSLVKHEGNVVQVYRPTVSHPQPREFRRVDNTNVNPIRTNEEKINTERRVQRENIERLPIHRAPESSFNRNMGNSGGRRGRRG